MARDADAVKITRKWARTGDVAIIPDLPPVPRQDPGLETANREKGWGVDFSTFEGSLPKREILNQIFREITGLCVEFNEHGGILEWDNSLEYVHPALVYGSDNEIYQSKQDVPKGRDPVNPANTLYWGPLVITGVGPARYPNDFISSYNQANTIRDKFISPATLADWALGPLRSGVRSGGFLSRRIHTHPGAANASAAAAGLIEIATDTEAKTGTDALRAITPFTFRAAGDDRYSQKSHDHSYAPRIHSHVVGISGFANQDRTSGRNSDRAISFLPHMIIVNVAAATGGINTDHVGYALIDQNNPQRTIVNIFTVSGTFYIDAGGRYRITSSGTNVGTTAIRFNFSLS